MYRREAMRVVTCAIFTLSGCSIDEDLSRTRDTDKQLSLLVPEIEHDDDTITLHGELRNEVFGGTEADTRFRNVRVVAYTESDELLCEVEVGTLEEGDTRYTLECPEMPHLLTATATEHPCDDPVIIEMLIYEGTEDDTPIWRKDKRRCNDDLPPDV